jgi:DNA polymerase-3 subunit delta
MQVKAEDLPRHLAGNLDAIYLISGEEQLLVDEACDAVITTAREKGFTERSVHHVDQSFRWLDLHHDAASMSLFAEKKILDVRVPPKKLDKEASAALREWVQNLQGNQTIEHVLLLRTGRLERGQRTSAWFKALEKAGVVTVMWPLEPSRLPAWLGQRGQKLGIQIDPEATQYLADRVEGNLLAAAQELQKLAALELPQPITLETLVSCLEDASRYTSFDLLDAMMAAQPQRVVRILRGLREESVALFAVLGAFTSQLRRLSNTKGMPPAKARLMQQFLRRIKDPGMVLAECAIIDQQGKGQLRGDAWMSLENLLLRLAGVKSMPLPSQDQRQLESL